MQNINWKQNFSLGVLTRGLAYFNQGRVDEIKKISKNEFKTIVHGNADYNVIINFSSENILSYCNCPVSDSRCKHVAAVLFKLDHENLIPHEKEDLDEKYIYPFEDFRNASDEYIVFDLEYLTESMLFLRKDFETAEKIIKENKIALDNLDVNGNTLTAKFKIEQTHAASIRMNPESIEYINCDYPIDYRYRASWYYFGAQEVLPPYVIAALLLLKDIILKENPGDLTSEKGEELLNFFTQESVLNFDDEKIDENENKKGLPLKFEPMLENNFRFFYLNFKIGFTKTVGVKNLIDLVEAYNEKKIYNPSKTISINFEKDYFDEESQKYFDFIKNIVEEQNAKKSIEETFYNQNFIAESVKQKIMIYGKRLDDFFKIVEGKSIEIKDIDIRERGTNGIVKFKEGSPKIDLEIKTKKNSNGKILLLKASLLLPIIIKGAENNYYLGTKHFYKIDKRLSKIINMFVSESNIGHPIDFEIGQKKIPEFINYVLPKLLEFCNYDEKEIEDLLKLAPPKGKLKFYFDSENEAVTCTAKTIYGQNEFDTTDFIFRTIFDSTRDSLLEKNACTLIKKYFSVNMETHEISTDDEEKIFNLLNYGLQNFMELGEVNMSESFGRLKIHKNTNFNVGVKLESNLLDLEITSDTVTQQQLLEILDGMKKRKKYIRLKNGDFINTQTESIEELNEIFETLNLSIKDFVKGKIQIPAYRALYIDKMLEATNGIYSQRNTHFKNLIKEFKTLDDSEFELPESLQNVLRPYQNFGYKWMRTIQAYNFAGILADDMGLGKTLQTISVLLAAKENNAEGTSLIVCPASLVFNWKHEFEKFAPQMKVVAITGTQTERAKIISGYKKNDVLVTSYDLLKRDIQEYEDKNFLYEIIDEGQFIKNHSTAAAKSVKIIKAKNKLALTGTPIENRLSELWSIFDFLMPGFLFSYDNFKKRFEVPIVKDKNENARAQLKKMVSPFILRRLKKDVLKDLPAKIEEIRYAEFDEAQEKLYKAQEIKIRNMLDKKSDDDVNRQKLQILAELTKIRQICCDPSLLFENYTGESAKRKACIELIQSGIEGEHKMLVFSQFTSMLSLLENDLKENNIKYYKITGETEKQKRIELVDQFNNDDVPVFLISLKAGGTGLNLTGADVVIHYDPWWNLAVQNQATDRAHRIGQTKIVSEIKLIAKNSIEEKIIELQNKKKDLADQILSGETGTIGSMSKEEILELLAG